jgi:ADP-ribose pyrophosphatase YjhB (NUDIX family)
MPDDIFWPPESYYRVSLKPLIFDGQGRLLVCKDKEGTWSMPGGGWDHGEDYESCIRRELAEELGLEVVSIGQVAFFYRSKAAQGQPKVAIALPVTLKNFDFVFNPDDEEVVEARFVTKDEFIQLPFQDSEHYVQAYANHIWQLVEKKS